MNLYGLPQPPVDSAIDPLLQIWMTSLVGAIAIATMIFSLIYWRRTGNALTLALVFSGGACMLLEPIVDLVGGCWHPAINQWTAFTALGRPMPAWLCLCYFAYFGLGSGLMSIAMARGMTGTRLWRLFILGMVGDAALEITLLNFEAYYYYGYQPLLILKFPLWAAPVNSLIALAAAVAAFRAAPYLRGWRIVLVVPMTLSVSAAVNAAVGWPAWIVINTELPWAIKQLGGLATFALAGWFMLGIVKLNCRNALLLDRTAHDIKNSGSGDTLSGRIN